MTAVKCLRCSKTFDVNEGDVGKPVECPHCGGEFVLKRFGKNLRVDYPDLPAGEKFRGFVQ